MYSALNIPDKI